MAENIAIFGLIGALSTCGALFLFYTVFMQRHRHREREAWKDELEQQQIVIERLQRSHSPDRGGRYAT